MPENLPIVEQTLEQLGADTPERVATVFAKVRNEFDRVAGTVSDEASWHALRDGGLGRTAGVDAHPRQLTAAVPAPGARLSLRVTAHDEDAVAVAYADPPGGTRAVSHAALAAVELTLRRRGHEITMSSTRGAYEYGARQGSDPIVPQSLPDG